MLLGALALLVSACNPFGLGPDELPSSLSDGDRSRINEVVGNFFAGVDAYNPQLAGDSMVTPGEIGIEDFSRMVLQIGALQSAELQYGYRVVEAASIDEAAGVVRASAATGLGNVRLELARRGGQWRVVRAPDLTMPVDQAPYRFETHITNTFQQATGPFTVVGELENVGDSPWLVISLAGYLEGPDGRTLRVDQSGLITRPFVSPGEPLPFRIDLALPEGTEFSEDAFRIVPNFRLERGADREILATGLTVDPAVIEGTPDAFSVTVSNGEDALRAARLIAYVVAEDGRLLYVYQSGDFNVAAEGSITTDVPGPPPEAATDASQIRIETWGVVPQPSG